MTKLPINLTDLLRQRTVEGERSLASIFGAGYLTATVKQHHEVMKASFNCCQLN